MVDPEKLSAGQFKYRFHQTTTDEGEEHISVGAFHPETGEGVAMATFGRDPTRGKLGEQDLFEPHVAYTREGFRNRGIGHTMMNVARYEQPGQSQPLTPTDAVSPKGLGLSLKYFGKEHPDVPKRATTPNWQNTEEVETNVRGEEGESGRTFGAPAMAAVTGPGSRESELARSLVPEIPGMPKDSAYDQYRAEQAQTRIWDEKKTPVRGWNFKRTKNVEPLPPKAPPKKRPKK